MNHQEIINHYKTKFKLDPLLRRIQNEGLEDILFDNEDYFSKVTFSDTYPSKRAAELLDMEGKEQTLLNYINRNDLGTYLNVYKQARFYRYDWESLFKFKMLIVLSEHGFTPMDIASIIGTRVETAATIETEKYKGRAALNTVDYYEIAKEIANDNFKHFLNNLNTFEEYKEIRAMLESEQTLLSLDLKLNDERSWSIQGRLDDLDGYLTFMQSTQTNNEAALTGGVLSRLFKRKVHVQDGMKDGLSSFEEKKIKLQESLDQTKLDKEGIVFKLEKLKEKIDVLKQVSISSHFQSNGIENNEMERMIKDDVTPKLIETE